MKAIFSSFLITLCIMAAAQQKINITDFKPLEGKWKGSLTYLDYKSNQPTTIPVNTMVETVNDSSFNQYMYYSDEPDKNSGDLYKINKEGTMLNEMKLVSKTKQADGSVKIVLEYKGPDGNDYKPGTMQRIMEISPGRFVITKMVKFDGEDTFFQRHQYSFRR